MAYRNNYGVQYTAPYMSPSAQSYNMYTAKQNTQPIRVLVVVDASEAYRYPVNRDTTLYIFVNETNGQIYTKQFDIGSGCPMFKQFNITELLSANVLTTPTIEPAPIIEPATLTESDSTIEERELYIKVENLETIVASLTAELNFLKQKL